MNVGGDVGSGSIVDVDEDLSGSRGSGGRGYTDERGYGDNNGDIGFETNRRNIDVNDDNDLHCKGEYGHMGGDDINLGCDYGAGRGLDT